MKNITKKTVDTRSAGKRIILLTGASGGLGHALAREYAGPGTHLVLWGRDESLLANLAQSCREAGATAEVQAQDLADIAGAVHACVEIDRTRPIDIAILAAGAGDIRSPGSVVEDAELVARLGMTNFVAPAAMAAALAERMASRGRGNIILIGSAASFHALPFAAAYSGSKAGLARFAQALRGSVQPHGISVTLVSPGFIDTAASRRIAGPKPFLLSPAEAATRIAKAIAKGQGHLIMPWQFKLLQILDSLLPYSLKQPLFRALTPVL